MAQLLPEGLTDPILGVIEEEDQSITYGETWSMHLGTNCSCGKTYPHLEVYGGRPFKVSGIDTMLQWIRLALSTERFRYEVYSDDYGVELDALIERSPTPEEVETEGPRMVREALAIDSRVEEVREVNLTVDPEDPTNYFIDVEVVTFTGDLEAIEAALQFSLEV